MQIVEPKSTRQCPSDCQEHRQRRSSETAAEDRRPDAACEDPPIYSSKLAGQPIVLSFCGINTDPPNPASGAFHAAFKFEEVGRSTIHQGSKSVRYLAFALLMIALTR
jgi:hypothetical protein